MKSKLQSYELIQQQHQKVYVPATGEAASRARYPKSSIPFAAQEEPERICGTAIRVGYTSQAGSTEVIYRLKLKASVIGLSNATIPGFFVLKNGFFVRYVPSNAIS